MKLAIMQPYFMPYIGYFQLIHSVDEFIVYDNIQYTKKGWINRNRILSNNKDELITLTLKKSSDYENIVKKRLSDNWNNDKIKMLNKIKSSYQKAPYFKEIFELINVCLEYNEKNLFNFINHSICMVSKYLKIDTPIIISSTINIDHSLKSQNKVIAMCKEKNASTYINAIGGIELYDKNFFNDNKIELKFIKSNPIVYKQFNSNFIPWLSIIDVMMFNSQERVSQYCKEYSFL
jgi:hypothetical protein